MSQNDSKDAAEASDFITVPEFATMLGERRENAYRLVAKGKIESIQVGGKGLHLIRRDHARAFVLARAEQDQAKVDAMKAAVGS